MSWGLILDVLKQDLKTKKRNEQKRKEQRCLELSKHLSGS